MAKKEENGKMIAKKYLPQYTYADYAMWEGNWELIGGIPYAMTPGPVWQHQFTEGDLFYQFKSTLNASDSCMPYTNLDWIVSKNTVVRPDLLIACGKIKTKHLEFPPVLVAEILSPSTLEKDLKLKFEIYEKQRVKYYLLLNLEISQAKIYMLENENYKLFLDTEKAKFNFTLGECEAEIDFGRIWPPK